MLTFLVNLVRLGAILVLLLCLPVQADGQTAGNHIISQEIFRDPSGKLTLNEVLDASFAPQIGIFTGGYTRDTIWMRLRIRPSAKGQPLVLHILPSYLNSVTLYAPDPAQPGEWRSQITGNSIPWRERPYAAIPLAFIIDPAGETSYYLRLNTLSNAMLHLRALVQKDAQQSEMRNVLWQGLYMAIILWVILWALQDYWLSRDKIILTFALVYLVYLIYVLAILGYLPPLLPDNTQIPGITFWLVTFAIITSLIFHRGLLGLFEISRLARWGLNGLLMAAVVAIPLLLLEQTATALKLNSLIALAAAPALFLFALTARNSSNTPSPPRIKLYYFLLLLSLSSYIIPILGWARGSTWTLYGALIQGLISAVLFGNLLHLRARQVIDQKASSQFELMLSEQQLALHKAKLAEQERFTAILTHELKNPLATIRFSLDAISPIPLENKRIGRIDRALNDIDALVERCALSNRIEQGQDIVRTSVIELAVLLSDHLAELPQHQHRIRTHIAAFDSRIRSDAQLLTIALGNLIDNALKYAPANSLIDIRLTPASNATKVDGVQVDVINQPSSNDFPDPNQIFDKYFRGPQTSQHSGLGLGLYLVKEIADKLGGNITYLPQDHQIIFRLWLPNTTA
jgi:signal transduction histidine kinase